MWTTLTSTAGGCWRNANYYCCYLLFIVLSLDLVPVSAGLPPEPWRQINNKCSASLSVNTRMAQREAVFLKVYKNICLLFYYKSHKSQKFLKLYSFWLIHLYCELLKIFVVCHIFTQLKYCHFGLATCPPNFFLLGKLYHW